VVSEETPIAIVRRLAGAGATGELICAEGELEVHVYLQQGRVAWATSSEARFAFGRELVRRCNVDPETLKELVEDCRRNRRPLGETLVQWGLASLEDVRESLRRQIQGALATLGGRHRAPTLFLERGAQYLTYERELTFELRELVDAEMAATASLGPRELLDRLLRDVPEIRWGEVRRRGDVIRAHPRAVEPRASTRRLAELAFGDEVDVVAVRSELGAVVGVARDDETSVWIGLPGEARLGAVFASLADALPSGRTAASAARGDATASSDTCERCRPALDDVLARWSDAEAACVLHDERAPALVHRSGLDGASFLAIARARTAMLEVEAGDAELASARSLVLGRAGSWLLASPVPDGSRRVLWLSVSRQASQGLAWALLGATARQIAQSECGCGHD
jgi:hypothetical protein